MNILLITVYFNEILFFLQIILYLKSQVDPKYELIKKHTTNYIGHISTGVHEL